jgi:hypothetical protein
MIKIPRVAVHDPMTLTVDVVLAKPMIGTIGSVDDKIKPGCVKSLLECALIGASASFFAIVDMVGLSNQGESSQKEPIN